MLKVRRIALLSVLLASGIKTGTFFAFQTYVQSMNATEQTGHFAKSAQIRKFASEDISSSCQETPELLQFFFVSTAQKKIRRTKCNRPAHKLHPFFSDIHVKSKIYYQSIRPSTERSSFHKNVQ